MIRFNAALASPSNGATGAVAVYLADIEIALVAPSMTAAADRLYDAASGLLAEAASQERARPWEEQEKDFNVEIDKFVAAAQLDSAPK